MPKPIWPISLSLVLFAALLLHAQQSTGERVGAKRLTTNQVEITQYASDSVVSPGAVFSLVLDIVPKGRVHLYAPGATDYQVVTLKVDPHPVLTFRKMRFPAWEIYYFAPLNERVPVYQKPFRLVQDVSLDSSRKAQALLRKTDTVTIKATLGYQACDDKVCFAPVSTPLSWTVRVRRADTERANVAKWGQRDRNTM